MSELKYKSIGCKKERGEFVRKRTGQESEREREQNHICVPMSKYRSFILDVIRPPTHRPQTDTHTLTEITENRDCAEFFNHVCRNEKLDP